MERAFVVAHPAKRAVFSSFPETVPAEGGLVYFRVRLLDRRGLSIADGSRLKIDAWYRRPGNEARPGEWTTLAIARGEGAAEATVTDGVAEFPIEVPPGCAAVRIAVMPGGGPGVDASPEADFGPSGFEYVVHVAEGSSFVSIVRPAGPLDGDAGCHGPILRRFGSRYRGCLRRPFCRQRGGGGGRVRIEARGLSPRGLATGGIRHSPSRSVVRRRARGETLRAERGGRTPESARPGSARARRIVRQSPRGPFRRGVPLGRGGQRPAGSSHRRNSHRQGRRSPHQPVSRRSLRRSAIQKRSGGHRARRPDVLFPRECSADSPSPAPVGNALGRALGVPALPPAETVTFPLQQTACPAIIVEPPSLGRVDEETPSLRAVVPAETSVRDLWGTPRGRRSDEHGGAPRHPRTGQLGGRAARAVGRTGSSRVDDTWRLLTSPEGKAEFDWLPAGIHHVFLRRGETTAGPFEIVLESGETRTFETRIPVPR